MELLYSLNQFKPVWVELGLQTIHEKQPDTSGAVIRFPALMMQ